MTTTVACISDLHSRLPETTPECDILVIAGDICPATNHTVQFTLIDSSFETRGIKFWGSPWQPPFRNWTFNLPEAGLAQKVAQIPADTDVLISHGPPYEYGDLVIDGLDGHLGSAALSRALNKRHLPLVVCGHIHIGHGIYKMDKSDTIVVNASCLDERYRQVYKPIMATFDDGELLAVRQTT